MWKEESREEYEKSFEEELTQTPVAREAKDRWDRLIEIIRAAAEKSGTIRKIKKDARGKKWMDKEVKKQRNVVWKHQKNYVKGKKDRTEEENKRDQETLIKERRKLKEIKKKKDREYWDGKWNKVEKSKNVTEMWEAIRPFKAKTTNMGKQISKEEWVTHFRKLLGEEKEGGTHKAEGERAQNEQQNISKEQEEQLKGMNKEISDVEIRNVLKGMKNRKAAGNDGITAEFLKGMPREGQKELEDILNEFWKKGELGRRWETGRIHPIHKAGDTNNAVNYRGITLLNTR